MRCLGMDLGTKTLGLAISDKLGLISSPYKVLRYNDINNSLGFASERSLNFKKLLETKTNKEIVLVDERLSTVEAENILISSDVRRDKRKKVIDEMAASIILDTYLRMVK